ncbi:MAG: hypothetical protein MI974_02130 [Chitinophagales bacterium]|nr:hypothetical protein [Chitinophagales bacterium]
MFNDQLLSELKEQLDLLKQPGPFPVNPVIEQALQLIHQLMEGADGSSGGGDIGSRVDDLEETVENHASLLSTIQATLLELEEKVNNCPTTEDIQILIDASLGSVNDNIQLLFSKDSDLDQRVTELENRPSGVSEERVEEIVEEKLIGIKADIHQLKQVDIPEIKAELIALEARVKALEEEPPGEGASKAWVLNQIEVEVNAIRSLINNIKNDLEDKIGRKADQIALESKADKTELAACKEELETALSEKADQSSLEEKADRSELEGKADISALESTRTELEGQIAEKANSSDLEACKEELEGALSEKADQSSLEAKADRSELEGKADVSALESARTELEGQIAEKANSSDLEACKEELETALSEKADQSSLEAKADRSELEGKADVSALESTRTELEGQISEKTNSSDLEACKEELETTLSEKADQSSLEAKADRSELEGKADVSVLESTRTDLEEQLSEKANSSDLEDCKEELETALSEKADQSSLEAKADRSELEGKADVSALESTRTELEGQISEKANSSDLEDCKEELKNILEGKADKTDLNELEDEVEAIREEWLEDMVNNPGLRLARLSLQGWGIVGGLEICSDDKDYLHITPGVGISPAGEIITEPGIWPTDSRYESYLEISQDDDCEELETDAISDTSCDDPCNKPQPQNLVFSHYVPLDKSLLDYCFFKKHDTGEAYNVWKLLQPTDDLPANSRPLTPQNDAETEYPFITNKVVGVLLVDDTPLYFLMEQEDVLEQLCCLPNQCNDDPKYDPDYIYEEDYSLEDNYVSDDELWACLYPAIRLPEIPLFRFGFFTDQDCAPDELDQTEFPNIISIDDLYNTWCPIVEEAINLLEKAVKMLIDRYHYSLFPLQEKQQVEKKLGMLSEKWTRFHVSNQSPQTATGELGSKYYAQCFYDWLRDLIAAYHELRWCVIELMNELKPYVEGMLKKQNRHLLLGTAHQMEPCGLAEPLRDIFYQPPIYNGNAARLEACRLYYQRLFQMIDGFYLEDFAPDSQIPAWCYNENEEGETEEHIPNFDCLKITPGKSYSYPLSEQSIPYYYPLLFHPQSLHHLWNHRRSKTRSVDRILSYHATDIPSDFPSYTSRNEIIRPLYYNLDAFDFYRIEGYLGKSKVCLYLKEEGEAQEYDVAEALQYLVQKHNLDFQVVKLTISDLQKPEGGGAAPYTIGSASSGENSYSLATALLGAEHLGGVFKGGAYILVYEEPISQKGTKKQSMSSSSNAPRVIASFSLPDKLPRELFVDSKS